MTPLVLESAIKDKSANVVVVGGGYVGLPLALLIKLAGYNVKVLDVDSQKVNEINAGVRPSDFPTCRVEATLDPSVQAQADVVVICVPTPLNPSRVPNLSALDSAVDSFSKHSRTLGKLLCIESTVYPGYTKKLYEKIGDRCNAVSFSSERINPGTPFSDLSQIPKVVSGLGYGKSLAQAFYSRIFTDVVLASSPTVAEFSKLLENSFRAANIALVNEMSVVCNHFGVDISEVIKVAATKPFGYVPFYPGPGVGGHCIPVDPHYLIWASARKGVDMPFLQQTMATNESMPTYVVNRVRELTNGNDILVVGVSYKEEVPDMRESPALKIIAELRNSGYNVSYHDPLIPELKEFELTSVNLDSTFDLGVVVTKHSGLNTSRLLEVCSVILDTRRVLLGSETGKVVRL